VLGIAVLLDAAALTFAFCMHLVSDTAPTAGALRLTSWYSAWAAALLAAILFALRASISSNHPVLGRALSMTGSVMCVVVGLVAGWPTSVHGPAGWGNWVAGLVLVLTLAMEAGYGHGVLRFAGSVAATLALLLATGLPASDSLPSPRELLAGGGITAVRALALAGGAAACTLAWAAANVTLGLIVLTPTRRGSIRVAGGAASRALAAAVLLLTCAAFLGGWPPQILREILFLSVLTVILLLLHARFAGWVQDLGLALCCSLLGGLGVAAGGEWAAREGLGPLVVGWLWVVALANACLIVHAVHRYWFGCPENTRV
jgi:hypothetical protein